MRVTARVVRWAVATVLLQGGVLALLGWMLPGFSVGNASSLAISAVIFTVAQVIAWPFIYYLSARIHPLLFPILSFGLAGVLVLLLTDLVASLGATGLHVDGFGSAILVALGLTFGNTLTGALFSLRDDIAYDWFVTRQIRRTYAATPPSTEPGVIFMEIDGLAEPVLRLAIEEGRMPTLRRWLTTGSHTITGWEPDLSSQTSASQAGILLGSNEDIPAFRWYEKSAGTLMVSSRMQTARALEARLNSGNGLLQTGASRWNVFSGGAPDCLCTYSTFGAPNRGGGSGRYIAYFLNPYSLPRALALYFGDIFRERWQAFGQVRRHELPRIHRGVKYAFIRAATTTVMQEMGLFMLISDMARGVPAVYATFFAYDEVAHHSGIDRLDALKVLGTLDRAVAALERAAASAPRPYHLVVLSDHGQSMGATFRQRTGQTLGLTVIALLDPDTKVTIEERTAEGWSHLNLAISEAMHDPDSRTAKLLRRGLDGWMRGEEVSFGPADEEHHEAIGRAAGESDVVVLASGNLGLISFPQWPERLTYEQIVDRFPRLIPGLVSNPEIGFVLVRSESEGGLVIGEHGIHYLDHGYAAGDDPLAVYGPNAAGHVKRTNGFSNAPDLLVMSRYDPETGEVAAFEELVGSHGGLGGPQTQPFIFHPVSLDPGVEPIVGAGALHQVMTRWLPTSDDADEIPTVLAESTAS